MSPNEVYERTRVGLAGLVPGRAARRILDSGLGQQRRTADAVSAAEMAKVLLGPVYRDLRDVLPPSGLRHQLKQLARTLRTIDPPPSVRAAEPSGRADAEELAEPAEAAERGDAQEAAVPERPGAAAAPGRPAPARTLPSDPELVLASLAVLDGVDGVGVFDASGGVAAVRGDLPEHTALGRVIAAGGALLGRHGALRTVCVTTSLGVLVAVPVPPQWLAVSGRPDLNLGAIYAALAALEEER